MSLEQQHYSLPLLENHPTKTIDFGSDGLACSLSTFGRLLSISRFHHVHGQIIIEPFAQFPSEKHYDQVYVRKYRHRAMAKHASPTAGFGLQLSKDSVATVPNPVWCYLDGSTPQCVQTSSSSRIVWTYSAAKDCVVQDVEVRNLGEQSLNCTASLTGQISINRAAYTQLTPQGDCSLPTVLNRVISDPHCYAIENPHLPASISIAIRLDGVQQNVSAYGQDSARPIPVDRAFKFCVPPGAVRRVCVTYRVRTELYQAGRVDADEIRPTQSLVSKINMQRVEDLFGKRVAFIILRNLDYLLSCCTVPVASDDGTDLGTCIITDHQCLPLGWNRDNYWQLDMLTSLLPHLDSIVAPGERCHIRSSIQAIQRSHLKWVFDTAQRPDGYWARSFFATGTPKDQVFQLDQQCYPLLEIAEYGLRNPSERPMLVEVASRAIDDILHSIMRHRAPAPLWLFETDETPADDEVAYPFHFSSHVLLWHTLQMLGRLRKLLPPGVIKSPVLEWAEKIKAHTLQYFITDHPTSGRVFAYLTSASGQYQFYHDANDLPTVMAPRWGFCAADDPVWLNTFAFAFSPANEGGWYPGGNYGGLGSVHTRDPWPLGDAQHLAMLCLTGGNFSAIRPVLDKITSSCQFDGMYSEAIDRHSGKVTSKNWFSWPGSFISSIALTNLPPILAQRH